MPPIKITTYDFSLDAIENLKSNFLADRMAKNRWGKKFAKLYKKHMNVTTKEGQSVVGTYDFTKGMRASTGTLTSYESDLDDAIAFKASLLENLQVESGGVWSIISALSHSYMSVLIETTLVNSLTGMSSASLLGLRFALCFDEQTADGRRPAWFYESGTKDATTSILEPLDEDHPDSGLYLTDANHTDYGHYSDPNLSASTAQNNALESYCVEDRAHVRFDANQDDKFAAIWQKLQTYALKLAKTKAGETGEHVSVVIGLNVFLMWLDDIIAALQDGIEAIYDSDGRTGEDLELLDHIGIVETLNEEIADPGEIKYIWFTFSKKIEEEVPYVYVLVDGVPTLMIDPNWEWWEAEQFDDLRLHVKNFHDYCVLETTIGVTVYVKDTIFDLPGHKIYWFVTAFLDVDAKAKDKSFFEKLLSFILFVVSIVLTIFSSNPMWLKILLVSTAVMGYFGVLSPELALAVAIISFGYGIYSTDLSSLSALGMFEFAIQNINMVMKMISIYDSIGVKKELEEDAKAQNENKSIAQQQEEAINYIYTSGYSQYDELYTMLYDFSPKRPPFSF